MKALLDIPFEERSIASKYNLSWSKTRGAWIFSGESFPNELKPYLPKRYSWLHYQMKSGRGNTDPITSTGDITLRDDQQDDVDTNLTAFKAGSPETLVASKTGTGKTFTALVTAMKLPDSGKILIVCPKSVIPNWRKSIDAVGAQGKRFCIINYESLKKVLKPPESKGKTQKRKTKKGKANQKRKSNRDHVSRGTPYVKWDTVILDESHYLDNPDSQRSIAEDSIRRAIPSAKVIHVTATAADNPLRLGKFERAIAWRLGKEIPRKRSSPEQWVAFCEKLGFTFEKTPWGPKWEKNDADLNKAHSLLFGGKTKWAVRTDPGWDSPPRYQVPIEMTKAESQAYEESWAEFKKLSKQLKKLKEEPKKNSAEIKKAQEKGLAAQIRYRQKAGILKSSYVAEIVQDLLEGDVQVAISAEFKETVNKLTEMLGGESKVALYTGDNADEREGEREAFQSGKKRVIIFTPSEGFNLHQNELGGNDVPRVQIVAEPSWSPRKGQQKEGRTSRDGYIAPLLYPSAVGTTDYKIVHSLMEGYESMSKIMGDKENDKITTVDKEFINTLK